LDAGEAGVGAGVGEAAATGAVAGEEAAVGVGVGEAAAATRTDGARLRESVAQ
jgi:hypothetical protein